MLHFKLLQYQAFSGRWASSLTADNPFVVPNNQRQFKMHPNCVILILDDIKL